VHHKYGILKTALFLLKRLLFRKFEPVFDQGKIIVIRVQLKLSKYEHKILRIEDTKLLKYLKALLCQIIMDSQAHDACAIH
jgi:hypothetical protein